MSVKYVDEFEFPAEAGFTGSSKTVRTVRPHTRRVYKKGGKVRYEEGGKAEDKEAEPPPKEEDKKDDDSVIGRVKKLKSRSERAMEELDLKKGGRARKAVGGPVHAKKGGFNRRPLAGKKY